MGYEHVKYTLNSMKFAKAIAGDIKVQVDLKSNIKLLKQNDAVKLINVSELYDRERQKSTVFRLYGRLDHIYTNELDEYTPSKLELVHTTGDPRNYNIQILYPNSSTKNCQLTNFNTSDFPFDCGVLYDSNIDCLTHKLYHGLPFNSSKLVTLNNRNGINIKIYDHKNGNNLNVGEYVYILPGKGGTLNSIYGFNEVILNRSITGDRTNIIIKPKGNLTSSYGGAYRRVINVSQADVGFKNSLMCEPYYTGGTNDGMFIRVNGRHNVEVGDFIDLRVTGSTDFNCFYGLHRVNSIVNDSIFKCDVPFYIINDSNLINTFGQELNNGIYNYRYRKIDGVPSEYYLRKFKVLIEGDRTTNILGVDYSLKLLNLSQTIWKNVNENIQYNILKQSGSDDDKIVSYIINRDINISGLRDNLNRPLSELYLGIIKRKDPEFQQLTPNFYSNYLFSGITTFDDEIWLPSVSDPNTLLLYNYFNLSEFNNAGLLEGQEYYGDLCEYNPQLLQERTLDPIVFRIGKTQGGVPLEGYIYEPFKKIQLRHFSEDIDTVDKYNLTIPDYYETVNGSKIWREINPYGFKDITQFGVKTINAPFTNNTHYYFNISTLLLRRQSKDPKELINIVSDGSC